MRFYKLTPQEIVVFHDELDLPPGKVRMKAGGGHAGHNGLRSMHQHIGEAYARVRLGIGHPGDKEKVAGYVLSDFAKADAPWLEEVLTGVERGAPDLAEGNSSRFMTALSPNPAPKPAPAPQTAQPEPARPAAQQPPASPFERLRRLLPGSR